jgi:tetratricopeptide (TPR) repeat protein
MRTARLREAEDTIREALALYRAIEDRLGEANTLHALGVLYVRTDRLSEGRSAYREALDLYKFIGDSLGEANTRKMLGDLSMRTDRFEEAENTYNQALDLYRSIEASLGEANVLKSLGDLYVRTGRFMETKTKYNEALQLFRSIGARLGEANTLVGLGNLHLAHKDATMAFRCFRDVLQLYQEIGDTVGTAAVSGYMSRAAFAAGRVQRAAVLGARTLRTLESLGDRFGQMIALIDLARTLSMLEIKEAANAAIILAWSHAAAIKHPLSEQIATQVGINEPPAAELDVASVVLATALNDCEIKLEAHGEDPYSPLEP